MDDAIFNLDTNILADEASLSHVMTFAEAMPGGFFIYHADGDEELIFANKAMLKIFGCDTMEQFKELTDFTFPGLVHPEDIDRVERIIAEQIAESQDDLDYVEYRIIRADGEIRRIMDYGHFMHTEAFGDIFLVFISDATEMVLETQEQKRQAEVIEGLAYAHESIMLLDLERYEGRPYVIGEPITAPFDENTLGEKSIDEAFRDYAEKFVVDEDKAHFLEIANLDSIHDLLHQQPHYTMNYRARNEDGEIEWLRLSLANVEDENKYHRAVLAFKIVTEQFKKLEAQTEERLRIERERDEALQISSTKSAFLFNMSHDVRTPLNAIVGFSTLARKYLDDPARVAECLDAVDKASDHLVDLIDDVLDMSQIESGSLQINKRPCNVANQLKNVLDIIVTPEVEQKLSFSVDIDVPDESVEADPLNLRRIFLKILDNAVRYTQPGGSISVELKGTKELHEDAPNTISYVFKVADTGIGMSEKFLEHIFESFEREVNSTASGVFGTGLGLSITKSLIDLMDGSIDVKSAKGAGSTFTVELSFDESPEQEKNKMPLSEEHRKHFSRRLSGKRVLIVEDNELNRIITENIMKDVGMEVESVMDGADAVRTIKQRPADYYDLVLMDIQMPIMNGYDATRAIRSIQRDDVQDLPIVALSANSMDEDRRRSIESGMNAHFAKPINVGGLLNVLHEYVDE